MSYEKEFTWPWPASTVILTGSFDKWSRSIHMAPSGPVFTAKVALPYGEKVSYKFIVDGNWTVDYDLPREKDANGNLNNFLTTPPAPEATPVQKEAEVIAEQPTAIAPINVPDVDSPPPALKRSEPAATLKLIADAKPTFMETIADAVKAALPPVLAAEPVIEQKVVSVVSIPVVTDVPEPEVVKANVEETPVVDIALEEVSEGTTTVTEGLKEFGGLKEEALPTPDQASTLVHGTKISSTSKPEENPLEAIAVKPETVVLDLTPTPTPVPMPTIAEPPTTPTKAPTQLPTVAEPSPTSVPIPETPVKGKPVAASAPVTPSTAGRTSSAFSATTAETGTTATSPSAKRTWPKRGSSDSPAKSLKDTDTVGRKKRSFIAKIKNAFK